MKKEIDQITKSKVDIINNYEKREFKLKSELSEKTKKLDELKNLEGFLKISSQTVAKGEGEKFVMMKEIDSLKNQNETLKFQVDYESNFNKARELAWNITTPEVLNLAPLVLSKNEKEIPIENLSGIFKDPRVQNNVPVLRTKNLENSIVQDFSPVSPTKKELQTEQKKELKVNFCQKLRQWAKTPETEVVDTETKVDQPAKAKEPSPPKETSNAGDQLNEEITAQGLKVRDLKSNKAEKAEVTAAVAILLDLKAKYKAAVGKDWKPDAHQTSANQPSKAKSASPPKEVSSGPGDQLNNEITAAGNKVRDLKTKKAEKVEIDSAVATLLDLKAKYKAATGQDWKPHLSLGLLI